MPSLKEYKAKLASLTNTKKMTKTMKMVSASKLYKTMDAQRKATAMAEKTRRMISNLAGSVDPKANPLLQKREHPSKVLVLLITSDKGLCAGFNNNLIKFLARWLESPAMSGLEISLATCGRRGHSFFRSRREIYRNFEGVTNRPGYHHAEAMSELFRARFIEGEFDEVYLVYNHFINPISQKPVVEKILPVEPDEIEAEGETPAIQSNYLLEPSREELLERLLPTTVTFKIYYALLENAAGENGARMTAMDNATTNATKLIELYTLLRNRARQAAITTELTEIISGAEALNN